MDVECNRKDNILSECTTFTHYIPTVQFGHSLWTHR